MRFGVEAHRSLRHKEKVPKLRDEEYDAVQWALSGSWKLDS